MKTGLLLLLLCLAGIAQAQPVSQHNIISVSRNSAKTTKTTQLVFDPALRPFYHGVASGDPTTSSVIIWTRVTPDSVAQYSISGDYQVATDTSFSNIISTGQFTADTATDYTVKIEVTGLTAGATVYYKFNALGQG